MNQINEGSSQSWKLYLGITALLGWFAIIVQFVIMIKGQAASTLELCIRFFSFFTILTNIIVAFCSSVLVLKKDSKWGMFFSKQQTLTAVTVYIMIVGIIYNLVLRFLWSPQGLQRVVDELLHLVVPLLFLGFWIFFVKKDQLKWKDIGGWLLYPLVYTFYILIRGSFSGFYPYPFMDVNQLGYDKVLINSVGVALAFIAVSSLFVGIGKIRNIK